MLCGRRDVDGLMFCLRAQLMRKQFGLGDPRMFVKSYLGTRRLTEDYVDLVAGEYHRADRV